MTDSAPESHAVEVELLDPLPAEVDIGTRFFLRLQLVCPSGCDLGRLPVALELDGRPYDADSSPILDDGGQAAGTRIEALAPREPGEYSLRVLAHREEADGLVHEAAMLAVPLRTRPHVTSVAVWGVPSPVVVGSTFRIQVGVRCSAQCGLGGARVVVRNEEGTPVAEGLLDHAPAPGTTALCPAEVTLRAPDEEGLASWSVSFVGSGDLEFPHGEASARFSFLVAAHPEHRVTVRVVEAGTEVPLDSVDVRLGAHRGTTDEAGVATVELPGGVYQMVACRAGWEFSSEKVSVSEDLHLDVEAVRAPDPAADEEHHWM